MDKFCYTLFWKGYNDSKLAIARGRSIILQIHKLKSNKTWLEAYRNSCLHALNLSFSSCSTLHRHTNTLSYTSLRMRNRGIIICLFWVFIYTTVSINTSACACENSLFNIITTIQQDYLIPPLHETLYTSTIATPTCTLYKTYNKPSGCIWIDFHQSSAQDQSFKQVLPFNHS